MSCAQRCPVSVSKKERNNKSQYISKGQVFFVHYFHTGHLVVYYPHMLVHPLYHRNHIGKKMMKAMQSIYGSFHQQMLTADGEAIEFYKSLGFSRAGKTEPMWVYAGTEH